MLRQKNEQSRYYGDFRGVDFSTDHTLVSERRFPYLVNMYKDYAAGAGQGIETIPGFRRRFVAPNGGRVHGIHSYKDKSGKRRVYVHAGDKLYKWGNYPNETGFSKEVVSVVREYDEYTSDIEGVGIAQDYAEFTFDVLANYDVLIDVRAIRAVGEEKWVSIYSGAVYYGESTTAVCIPDAYSFRVLEDKPVGNNNYRPVRVMLPKVIKDKNGTVVATFATGDAVEVQYVSFRVDHNQYWWEYSERLEGITDYGTDADGRQIYRFVYDAYGADGSRAIPWYRFGDGEKRSRLDESMLSEQTYKWISGTERVRDIQQTATRKLNVIEWSLKGGTSTLQKMYVYCYYDEERGLYYQESTAGERLYIAAEDCIVKDDAHEGSRIGYNDIIGSRTSQITATALEYDEYAAEGKLDYNCIDISIASDDDAIAHIYLEGGEELPVEQFRREGKVLLITKDMLEIGRRVIVTFGESAVEMLYDDMNDRESQSFVFGERLYIIDGKKYLYIDDTGVHRVVDNAYVPTTYINIVPGGENADAGAELEPRNMLSPYFKNTFIPDGETMEYHLNEKSLKSIAKVTAFDETFTEGEDYTVDLEAGTVKFSVPPAPPAGGAHVEIGSDGLSYVIEPGDNFYSCNGLVGPTEEDSEIVVGNYHNGVRVKALVAGKRDGKSGFGGNLRPMKTLDVSPGILSIKTGAFYMCIAKNIVLHEGLEHIYTQAFMAMSYINQLTIPSTVKEIDSWAFFDVPFETVTFLGKPTKLDENAFFGCDRLKTIKVPWKSGEVPGAPWGAPEGVSVLYEQDPGEIEPVADFGYPELYAGVEITAEKAIYPAIEGDGETTGEEFRSMIESATIATVFDNRVFFSGVPSKPNFIFWSSLKNPSYIGILNYQQDGIGTTPITAMVPVANSLLVLRGDTEDGGAAFYHTPVESGIDVMAKSYPSSEGLAGIGCLGAACNFLDDPVYISRLGLEAIGYLSLQNERSREHRSSLVDAKLVNAKNLASARMCEWCGYLVVLVDGKIFLADSRQKFADATGAAQYEWYYLEDIGVFEGQYKRYEYLREFPEILMDGEDRRDVRVSHNGVEYTVGLISDILPDVDVTDVAEKIEKVVAQVTVNDVSFEIVAAMYEHNGSYYACLCNTADEMIGGTFCPAVEIKTIDDNIFFGTTNGVVCSFNFDKRGSDGAIPADYYTFDGRTIYSGCALKMDNCGIPHMTKTTVKKSTVVKAKSFMRTAAKVRVRTNKNPFNEIARINGTRFSFEDMDFSDFSFVVGEDTLFAIREKEKKWVEKQYYVYSDEYKKPFALYYLAYKYYVAGKYKG